MEKSLQSGCVEFLAQHLAQRAYANWTKTRWPISASPSPKTSRLATTDSGKPSVLPQAYGMRRRGGAGRLAGRAGRLREMSRRTSGFECEEVMETKAMLSPLAGATTVVNRRIETGLLSDFVVGDDGEDLLIGGAGDDVKNGMALADGQSQSAHAGEFAATDDNAWREVA